MIKVDIIVPGGIFLYKIFYHVM